MTTKRNKHKTLGEVANAKHFNLRRRMPGWRPDEIDHSAPCGGDRPDGVPTPPGTPDVEVLFPEEALLKEGGTFHKFEPQVFNTIPPEVSWILGKALTSSHQFDGRLLDLQKLLQSYNRALYELRRLHLKADQVPDKDNMRPINGDTTFQQAEVDWSEAVSKLSQFLETGDGKDMTLDVVEVNKYIVSVRVVEGTVGNASPGIAKFMEIGGSSSSHIRIPFP